MKILFDHPGPFLLMHGGFQIQIEQTSLALKRAGVDVEYLRWWDEHQRADIIHYFGRPKPYYIDFARKKGIQVVMTQLLTGLGSRAESRRRIQKWVTRTAQAVLPGMATAPFGWQSYRMVDAAVLLTPWEASLMRDVFGVEASRLHVIPNGVEEVFLANAPAERGRWLLCTAAITERKRVVELAEAALQAKTPVWIVGKPYDESDPYHQRFLAVAQKDPQLVRYEGPVHDRSTLARVYREARGFVLLSTEESLSLSALEAAACGCPLLLSDLPWARTVFKDQATYCPVTDQIAGTAQALQSFYAAAPTLPRGPKPVTWLEVAGQLKTLYQQLLSGRPTP